MKCTSWVELAIWLLNQLKLYEPAIATGGTAHIYETLSSDLERDGFVSADAVKRDFYECMLMMNDLEDFALIGQHCIHLLCDIMYTTVIKNADCMPKTIVMDSVNYLEWNEYFTMDQDRFSSTTEFSDHFGIEIDLKM